MFKNNQFNDIYESRYIASWIEAGGHLYYREDVDDFSEWLLSEGLTEEEVKHVVHLATCGKFELKNSAEKFLNKQN